MIDLSSLEQYFPQVNKPLIFDGFTFTILFRQDDDTFLIDLKIKQQDTKQEHLIKFRLGLGRDEPRIDASHETDMPHFEINLYKRGTETFSATIYFTFHDLEKVMEYAKGTIVIMDRIVKQFVTQAKLGSNIVQRIVYDEAIMEELSAYEPILLDALYDCYKKSDLVVREGGRRIVIKTPRNFRKYLGIEAGVTDLDPLVLPLLNRIEGS
jgi:hypothetical protein